jgi:bacterioferritin (cytochrome b1)
MIRFDTYAKPTTLEQDLDTARAERRRLRQALVRCRDPMFRVQLEESLEVTDDHIAWIKDLMKKEDKRERS